MRGYRVPGGAGVRERTHVEREPLPKSKPEQKGNYGADGQVTAVETGQVRKNDNFGEEPNYADYPKPGEHAISLPSEGRSAGKSPSETERGHPNPDKRAAPAAGALRFTLGGSPGGGASHGMSAHGVGRLGRHNAGSLGRAKEMLADRNAGRGATGRGGDPEGKHGPREFGGGMGSAMHESPDASKIQPPGMGEKSGRSVGQGHSSPGETAHFGGKKGLNFAFGGGVGGGRGRDRTA